MNIGFRLLLVLLSSGLGILIYPPVSIWWLAVVAWVPLMWALKGAKPSSAMYMGLLHGVIFYGVTLSWIMNIFSEAKTTIIPLVMVLALFTALFSRGYAMAYQKYGASWVLSIFASCWWVAMELVRSEIFHLKFPWMTLGAGLGPMWLSPLVGVYGISGVIIFATALLAQKRRCHLVAGVVIMLTLVISVLYRSSMSDDPSGGIRVMAVQSEALYLDTYKELTQANMSEVDLIVWPEYALTEDIRKDEEGWRALRSLAADRDALIVTGTRTDLEEGGWYNTALTLSRYGEVGAHYKNHTVHFFDDGIAGRKAEAVTTSLGKIGTPICFDCDYQDVVRRMVADGAELITSPTMDAEHWSEKQKLQHSELFRHRAAENRRWVVVAATSGLTQFIDPYGNRVKSLPLNEDGTLVSEVNLISKKTIYTRLGWMFPWLLLVVGFCWLILIILMGRKKESVKPAVRD